MKNEEILKNLWRDEVVNSKKRNLLRLVGSICGIKESQARQRMCGYSSTNDAELFEIVEILRCNNVNVEDYEGEIRKKKCKYFGGYEAIDFE